MRELLSAVLRAEHFVVDAVADRHEVSSASLTYTLVLADVPFGESCHGYAHALVAECPSFESHIVLMSADDDDDSTAGDPPLLKKPFDRKALLAILG